MAIFPAAPEAVSALSAALPAQTTDTFKATLEPGARPALGVVDLAEADAVAAGRALGLDAILFWDGRRAQVLVCR